MDNHETYEEFERRVMDRALDLTAGRPPEFNLVPALELVRRAFSMGYDVVRRDGPSPVQS